MHILTPEEIAIVITTYNRPDALGAVLASLLQQTAPGFHVYIADDGSCDETLACLDSFKAQLNLHHIWQQDDGFRAAMIRNKAVAKSQQPYVIFLDGDCITPPSFVQQHIDLAETGYLVGGNRVLLSENFTEQVLQQNISLAQHNFLDFCSLKLNNHINRCLPLLYLPLGPLRKLQPKRWRGIKTCNLAMWRKDFVTVNGFEETYQGWGYEDSDLVVRLLRKGIKHKSGRYATGVLHLYHQENDRSQHDENLARLEKILGSEQVVAEQGLSQYD